MADSTKRYIAVDLGAECGKVVLASVASGKVTTEILHSFPVGTVHIGGRALWDIYAAYAGVLKGLSIAGSRGVSIESVGIDAWGPGLVPVAGDGSFPALPRLCNDFLSESVHSKFFKRLARRDLYEATGVNVLDSGAALQLFCLRRERSSALEFTKYFLSVPDAMVYLLTGKRVSGFTSLSAAGLLDRRTGKLSKEVLNACKVRPKRFPAMVQAGTKIGKLTEEVGQATGLGRVQVVAVAGHNLASAVAALPVGATAAPASGGNVFGIKDGVAFISLGPVCVMGVETASPVVNDQTFEMNLSNEAGVGGANLLVRRIPGMDLLSRCVAAWRAAGRAYGPEDLARMAREGVPAAAQLDPEDPALLAVSDAPAAIVRYCSLRSMAVPADDAAIVRLVYTSLAEKLDDVFVGLQSVCPFRLKSLYLFGPGVQDSVLCQMIADECAVPVTAGPEDAAVLGNVLVQSGLTRDTLAGSLASVTYTPGSLATDYAPGPLNRSL